MKKIILFSFTTLLLTAVSCTKNNSIEPVDTKQTPVSFLTSNAAVSVETKTTEVTGTTLETSGFKVSATTGSAGSESAAWTNIAFTKTGSVWTGDKYWPDSDPSYHFYASNIDLAHTVSGATVNASNDVDVVCAYMATPTYKVDNTLTFEHVFARIGSMTVSAASGYTISGVSILIIPKVSGTYNLLAGAGQTDGTGWSGTSTGSAQELANTTPGTKSNDVYLVPGRYTLTATWTATRGDYTKTFTGATYDVDIVGGKVNTIAATLGGLAQEIRFSVIVSPWGSNAIDADFMTAVLANGHDFVDLGLRSGGNKILFATCNIGASAPQEYGDYFAWGETSKRYTSISGGSVVGGSFEWSNCPYHTGSSSSTGWSKYIPTGKESYSESGVADNKLTLEASDDVATVLWGGNWRMPDKSDLEYLKSSNVNFSWTDDYNGTGVHGRIITGKGSFSSASLFLPAAGWCSSTYWYFAGSSAYYWSRSVYSAYTAYYLIDEGYPAIEESSRYYGLSVRPVLVIPE